jgi:hypothetical protein
MVFPGVKPPKSAIMACRWLLDSGSSTRNGWLGQFMLQWSIG